MRKTGRQHWKQRRRRTLMEKRVRGRTEVMRPGKKRGGQGNQGRANQEVNRETEKQ